MTPNECAENWKQIVKIYNETRDETPEYTIGKIVEGIGKSEAYTVFSTVAKIKMHDGRIYGRSRDVMERTSYVEDAVEWKAGNPMIRAGMDDIHTTHINQLINALIDYKEEANM